MSETPNGRISAQFLGTIITASALLVSLAGAIFWLGVSLTNKVNEEEFTTLQNRFTEISTRLQAVDTRIRENDVTISELRKTVEQARTERVEQLHEISARVDREVLRIEERLKNNEVLIVRALTKARNQGSGP